MKLSRAGQIGQLICSNTTPDKVAQISDIQLFTMTLVAAGTEEDIERLYDQMKNFDSEVIISRFNGMTGSEMSRRTALLLSLTVSNHPATCVMYAAVVLYATELLGRHIVLEDIPAVLPHGFPDASVFENAWDAQKLDGWNGLDEPEWWTQ